MNMKKTASAQLDWKNLPFDYMKTDYNIRHYWKDGHWSEGELVSDEYISLHMAAPTLHYGQEAFEGLKAFTTKDGRVVAFRPEENARRLKKSCERIFIPPIPEEMFIDSVHRIDKHLFRNGWDKYPLTAFFQTPRVFFRTKRHNAAVLGSESLQPFKSLLAVMERRRRHVERNIFVGYQFTLRPVAILPVMADVVIGLHVVEWKILPVQLCRCRLLHVHD